MVFSIIITISKWVALFKPNTSIKTKTFMLPINRSNKIRFLSNLIYVIFRVNKIIIHQIIYKTKMMRKTKIEF
jgi:hypothetical protein